MSNETKLAEALRIGLAAAESELAQRKGVFYRYPDKWAREQADVDAIKAALAAHEAAPAQPVADPCPGCRPGAFCRTPECGRLKLRAQAQPAPAQPVAVPLTLHQIMMLPITTAMGWVEIVRIVERAHGIAAATKEQTK